MKFVQNNLLSLATLAAMVLLSAIVYSDLPAELPSSFSWSGETLETLPKELVAALMPAIYLAIIVVMNFLIRISPRKFSMPNSKHAMDIMVFGVGVMLAFLHVSLLLGTGDFEFFARYFSWGMAAFLIIVGNVFGKTERNFFLGLRTPWTLASHANWKATHRLAGKLMVASGAVLAVSTVFWPSIPMMLVLTLTPVLIPVLFSVYYYWVREKEQEEAMSDEGSAD